MTNDELIECAESVLNFLLKSDKEYIQFQTFSSIPSLINMMKVLEKYNTKMVDFAEILNNKLCLLDNPLWVNYPQEFFSNHNKSEKFFKDAINILLRQKKINKIKSMNYDQ